MKPVARFFVCLLCVVTVSGCWDRREVNDLAFVIAMGLDKEPNGMYRLSVQVPLVSNLGGPTGGGGGTSGDKAYYVDSAVGKTIRDANKQIQSRMSRHLYYAHHRMIVIGEDLAKDGIRDPMDVISRFPENRLTAYLVMAKGKAIDLLNAQPQFERFSGEAMRELTKAETIAVSMKDIAQMLNTAGVDAFLPVFAAVDSHPKGKSKEIQAVGLVTFRDAKLEAVYPSGKMSGLRWFQRSFSPFSVDIRAPDGKYLSVFFVNGHAKVKPVIKQGRIHYDIRVYSYASVIENMSDMDLGEESNINFIEKKLSEAAADKVKFVIEETKKHRADTLGLGIILARHYPSEWRAKYQNDWRNHLSRITYTIHCNVKVNNIGQTTKNITKEHP